jgi:hypothetical protein
VSVPGATFPVVVAVVAFPAEASRVPINLAVAFPVVAFPVEAFLCQINPAVAFPVVAFHGEAFQGQAFPVEAVQYSISSAVVFLAVAFPVVAFPVAAFLAVAFPVAAFPVVAFRVVAFLVVASLVVTFLAVTFLAVAFPVAASRGVGIPEMEPQVGVGIGTRVVHPAVDIVLAVVNTELALGKLAHRNSEDIALDLEAVHTAVGDIVEVERTQVEVADIRVVGHGTEEDIYHIGQVYQICRIDRAYHIDHIYHVGDVRKSHPVSDEADPESLFLGLFD